MRWVFLVKGAFGAKKRTGFPTLAKQIYTYFLAQTMPIRRSKSQPSKSLREFYDGLENETEPHSGEVGNVMLKWIEGIEQALPNARIYGLTSHFHLILMPGETYEGPWAVRLIGNGMDYKVSLLMSEEDAPWPGAYVSGECQTFEQALAMSLLAIRSCGYWPPEQLKGNKT